MKLKKVLAMLLATVMCVSALSACGSGGSAGETGSGEETQAAGSAEAGSESQAAEPAESGEEGGEGGEVSYKDTITIATASDQNYMDGQMNNTNDVYLRACYSQLVRRNADNEIVGDLADSWEVSEDGRAWTFHLKKGVLFHSGKELTADDVKASYDRLLNQDNPVRYTSLAAGYIKECVKVDDYTVQLISETPIASMLANLCHRSNLILNSDYIEQYGADLGLTAESVDGTGPYRLASWDRDQEMVLERFDDYFMGAVPTKTIDILIVSDATARQTALETGQVDIGTVDTSVIPVLMENEDIQVLMFDSIASQGLQFNCAHPILKDKRLRQAVSYAIDRQAIIDALYSVIGEVGCTAPVNPMVWGYTNLGVIQQDQEKAKELMAEAGYPDGFEFSIMVYTNYNKSLETCEMIASDLAEVGITATIEPVDNATFNASMGNRSEPGEDFPWGLFFMGYGAGTADCDEGLRRIWTTSPDGNNNNNYGWYSNAEVDQLLADAAVEMDEQKRLDLYAKAEQIIYIDDPAAIFTNDRFNVWTMSSKVEGFTVNVNNVIFWDNLRCAE